MTEQIDIEETFEENCRRAMDEIESRLEYRAFAWIEEEPEWTQALDFDYVWTPRSGKPASVSFDMGDGILVFETYGVPLDNARKDWCRCCEPDFYGYMQHNGRMVRVEGRIVHTENYEMDATGVLLDGNYAYREAGQVLAERIAGFCRTIEKFDPEKFIAQLVAGDNDDIAFEVRELAHTRERERVEHFAANLHEYMHFRGAREGVDYELDEEFFLDAVREGVERFDFGLEIKGRVMRDVQRPDLLEDWVHGGRGLVQ